MARKRGEVGLESGSSPIWSRVKRDEEYSVTCVRADAGLATLSSLQVLRLIAIPGQSSRTTEFPKPEYNLCGLTKDTLAKRPEWSSQGSAEWLSSLSIGCAILKMMSVKL